MNCLTIIPRVFPTGRRGLFPVVRDLRAAKMSHEVIMPTTEQLRHIDDDDETIEKDVIHPDEIRRIKNATWRLYEFSWSQRARLSGARTNERGSMLVGYTQFGSQIWASVVTVYGPGNQVLFDAEDRLMIQIVIVDDQTDFPLLECIILYALNNLDDIAYWHTSIQGSTLAERYAFIYDALVEETKHAHGAWFNFTQ
ncbi:hypothetical protein K504DRAFT_505164 [Pleomassaria siparia CBS 279.74]|uniref:Uncharacterized protein n=1 Tax=Pleomassaria siparia CBS 279.74 TaxID=1314801 RepID=A0A6G1K0E8_9PLEO|nr:hypothetical protein K504DRAFT_505164 [Pleomassaria siparia CBS 279.74]